MNDFLAGIVCNVALLMGSLAVSAPDSLDSAAVVSPAPSNRFEARYGEPGATLEYRHSWFWFLSTDAWLSTNAMRGAGFGLSVDPWPNVTVQGFVGLTSYTDRVLDGPVFDPEYTYGFRGGAIIPLDLLQSRVYVSITAGKAWAVDKDFKPVSGFLIPREIDVVEPTAVRREVRTLDFFEIGVGLRF